MICSRASRTRALINFDQKRNSFYNKYKHGPTRINNPTPNYIEMIKAYFGREGLEFVKAEAKRTFLDKPFRRIFPKNPEEDKTYIFEHFDSDERIKSWKPVADSDSLNGFSTSSFVRSNAGHGLFTGVLDNRVPDDGVTMKSGAVGLIGPQRPRDQLLQRETHWDWSAYNTVEIRFRGDGRRYMLVLNTGTYTSDLQYYDIHGFPLYTRGGPYWQTYRIPFSKFIFGFKGRVQDEQGGLKTDVKFVAITLEDSYDGPFALELDYVGLRYEQPPFEELTAYEGYTFPHIKYRPLQVDCDPPDQTP